MKPDRDFFTLASILSRASLPFAITADEVRVLRAYIDLLLQWNLKFSLTTYENPESATYGLILPSLAFSELIPRDSRLVDLGSGPGIPSVPLAIMRPDLELTLVESGEKPIRVIEAVIEELNVRRVHILNVRAEDAAHDENYRIKFDIAVARSFAKLPVVIEAASAYVRPGGSIVVHASKKDAGTVGVSRETLSRIGCGPMKTRLVDLGIPEIEPIGFVIVEQEKACPNEYPRRWKAMKNSPLWDIKSDPD